MKFLHIFCLLLIVLFIDNVSGMICEEETFFGITRSKSCPGLLDSLDAIYCCGQKEDRRCCNTILGLREEDFEEVAKYFPTLIGVVVAVIIGIVLCCFICCCCCPFCLLHKRRNRGIIHQPAAAVDRTNVLPTQAPTQPSYAPIQSTPYPTQPAPYPTQPAAYPGQAPAPYPTQPPAPYPTQPPAPYPTQPPAPGFGSPPVTAGFQMQPFAAEQPPPYSEKQQAYNPNF